MSYKKKPSKSIKNTSLVYSDLLPLLNKDEELISSRTSDRYLSRYHPDILEAYNNSAFKIKSEFFYSIKTGITPPPCLNCGKDVTFIGYKSGYRDYCSSRCVGEGTKNKVKQTQQEKFGGFAFDTKEGREKAKQTNLDRYGHEAPLKNPEVQKKHKATMLKNHGVDSPLKSKTLLKKSEQTNLDLYGVTNVLKSKPTLDKIKQTNLDRYGHENPFGNKEIQDKIKQTNLDRYGHENHMQSREQRAKVAKERLDRTGYSHQWSDPKVRSKCRSAYYESTKLEIKERLEKRTTLTWIEPQQYEGWVSEDKMTNLLYKANCSKCNQTVEFDIRLRCFNCEPIGRNSSYKEEQLLEFIQQNYTGTILQSDRTLIRPFELDLYLPDLSLAIEFNGSFWHSSWCKSPEYHKAKSKKCLDKGVSLIHVWEHDWDFKLEIIKSMLKSKLGVMSQKLYARRCVVSSVPQKEVNTFLDSNHLHGSKNSRYRLGLYHNNDLVSVLTATERNGYLEIDRFASLLNHTIVGGFSKLFSRLPETTLPLLTYADRDWSPDPTKTVYSKFMKLEGSTDPKLYFFSVETGRVYSRYLFQKHNLKERYPDYDGTNVNDFLSGKKIFSIRDSGNFKYIKHTSKV